MTSQFLVTYYKYHDDRGFMSPLFEEQLIANQNICIKYTYSNTGFIRGFHWQSPPFLQEKNVYILSGEIEDLICPVVDGKLQIDQIVKNRVSSCDNVYIKIPSNYAHAYKALTQNTIVLYVCKGLYNKESELTFDAGKFFL